MPDTIRACQYSGPFTFCCIWATRCTALRDGPGTAFHCHLFLSHGTGYVFTARHTSFGPFLLNSWVPALPCMHLTVLSLCTTHFAFLRKHHSFGDLFATFSSTPYTFCGMQYTRFLHCTHHLVHGILLFGHFSPFCMIPLGWKVLVISHLTQFAGFHCCRGLVGLTFCGGWIRFLSPRLRFRHCT